jgi:vancomycin resistance protein YoaR
MRMIWKLFVFVFIVLLVSAGCATGEAGVLKLAPETSPLNALRRLPEGSSLDELNLSKMNPQEAEERVRQWSKDKLEQTLFLVYNETEIPCTFEELGISLDFDKTWEDLWKHPGQKVSSTLEVESVTANRAIQEKLGRFTRSAVDATYTIEKDKFVIKPAIPGRAIQADSILHEIRGRSFASLPKRIAATVVEVPAAITTEALKTLSFDGVVGEYVTKFNVNDKNRTVNLHAASSKLDKKVLNPGETLSFNDTIGPRTAATGFKDAYIIINNEYVQGIGGGICQVSSTLYTAAVLANLPIVERSPHAVAVAYIPLGQDATVNYPNLDLKLRNDTQSIIYIRSEVKSGTLTVRLYGKRTDKTVRFEQQIERETDFQIVRKTDATLPPGTVIQDQIGSKGYVVKTWKIVKDASGKETKQLLSRDEYAPAHKILRVGAD